MRFVVCVLASCFFAAKVVAVPHKAIEPSDTTKAQKIIKARLIDPYSVRFEMMSPKTGKARDGQPIRLTCGTYNAKNRLGGYVGAEHFVYVPSEHAVYTTSIERLGEDGADLSADEVTKTLDATNADSFKASLDKLKALEDDVKFWVAQCEDA